MLVDQFFAKKKNKWISKALYVRAASVLTAT
jgi:hypothetical protein